MPASKSNSCHRVTHETMTNSAGVLIPGLPVGHASIDTLSLLLELANGDKGVEVVAEPPEEMCAMSAKDAAVDCCNPLVLSTSLPIHISHLKF